MRFCKQVTTYKFRTVPNIMFEAVEAVIVEINQNHLPVTY
jgi:hypothetical protein